MRAHIKCIAINAFLFYRGPDAHAANNQIVCMPNRIPCEHLIELYIIVKD